MYVLMTLKKARSVIESSTRNPTVRNSCAFFQLHICSPWMFEVLFSCVVVSSQDLPRWEAVVVHWRYSHLAMVVLIGSLDVPCSAVMTPLPVSVRIERCRAAAQARCYHWCDRWPLVRRFPEQHTWWYSIRARKYGTIIRRLLCSEI